MQNNKKERAYCTSKAMELVLLALKFMSLYAPLLTTSEVAVFKQA